MKKTLFGFAIAAVALLVASCGKKELEGEALNTRYYSLVVPNGYKVNGSDPDKSFSIVKLKEDGKGQEEGSMWFNFHAYSKTDKYHEPSEMKDMAVERGDIDKGEQQYGGNTYYVSLDEEYGKLKFRTKLADNAVLEIHVKGWNLEDPIIKEILDNIVIKETPDAVNPNYDCEYFSVVAPEGWVPERSSSKVRMVKEDLSITVNTTTVSFDKVQENWKSFERRGEMKVGDITWLVFVNDRSKLYNLLTDITSEPDKALTVTTFKVLPDDAELKKVLESIKLKK